MYDDLLSKIDIVDVVKGYVDLKQKGESWAACCPFHDESTPSFSVSPKLQIYKCFSAGCDKGGNAISFVAEYEGINYHEAFIKLARENNLTHLISQDFKEAIKFYKANKKAAQVFHETLLKSPRAIKKLKERGITKETAKAFNLGFSPNSQKFLLKRGLTEAEVKLAKLSIYRNLSYKKEVFRNRITIPFYQSGNIVGFSGRTIDDSIPKYLNTKESDYFKKKDILFGWQQNARNIRDFKRVIVVEGQFDVISLYNHGINYVVGIAGSYLSEKSVDFLKRSVKQVILFADGDEAGVKAVIRSCLNLVNSGVDIKIIYKEGEDPDSLINKMDWSTVLRKYSYRALPFIFETSALEKVMEFISLVDDPFKQSNYLKELSNLTGKEEFQLERMIQAPTHQQGLRRVEEGSLFAPLDKLIILSFYHSLNLSSDEKKVLLNHIKSKGFKSRDDFIANLKAQGSTLVSFMDLVDKGLKHPDLPFLHDYLKKETKKVKISKLKDKYTKNQDPAILKQIQELTYQHD